MKGVRPLILASTSPRRLELLNRLGLAFSVVAPAYEEDMTLDTPPRELAMTLALGKARSVADHHPNAVVIGADTFLVHDGSILGKPANADEARHMLSSLQGRDHTVITGYAVIEAGVVRVTDVSESYVRFRPMTAMEIDRYVATGEPLDKAGSYALQGIGAMFVEKVEGDVAAIIGLPLSGVAQALSRLGYTVPASAPESFRPASECPL